MGGFHPKRLSGDWTDTKKTYLQKEDLDMRRKWLITLTVTSLMLLFTSAGSSLAQTGQDEVKECLKRAQELYDQGKYSEAISELQFAISAIQDKQASGYQTVLPEAPAGWQAGEIETNKVPGAIMGGGVMISRNYTNGQGASVTITVMGESPTVSSLLMMASNPMFMGAGNRMVRIKGNKAIEEWHPDTKSGQLSVIIGSKAVVTVEGSGLASKDVLFQFANLVDYDKIKKLMEE